MNKYSGGFGSCATPVKVGIRLVLLATVLGFAASCPAYFSAINAYSSQLTGFQAVLNNGKYDDQNISGLITKVSPAAYKQLGLSGQQRIDKWLAFINQNRPKTVQAKLKLVNEFFNKMQYVEDMTAWKKADFWATPLEVIIRNGGDCEDLAIAKYFTLRTLGVRSDLLRLTFVKDFKSSQNHMVLDYTPESPMYPPFVLDNMLADIVARPDLTPVYSFNEDSVWSKRKLSDKLGSPMQIEHWALLQQRLQQQHGVPGN